MKVLIVALSVPLLACASYHSSDVMDTIPDAPEASVHVSRATTTAIGWLSLRGTLGGVTLGRHIYLHPRADSTIIRHELEHVKQWERYGWTFPFRYLWASLFQRGNRFEEAADSACVAYWTERGLEPDQMACGAL